MSEPQHISLLFGGDFAPHTAYERLIIEHRINVLAPIASLVAQVDFSMVNLEVPLCAPGMAVSKAGPALRAAPETLRVLNETGITAVSLANNHILDYGVAGLTQSITALEQHGLFHVGAGPDRATAEAPLRIILHGRRISIFSVAEQEFNLASDAKAGAAILDPLRLGPQLLAERAEADAVLICLHGGNEYFAYPRPGLRRICRFLIEMGADAVIGHHPHVPGSYEFHNGKPILYSLGNLIFHKSPPPAGWDEGYLARLTLKFASDGSLNVAMDLIPYNQGVDLCGLRLMEHPARDAFLARVEAMSHEMTSHEGDWFAIWQRYVAQRNLQTIIDLSSPIRFKGLRRLMKYRALRNFVAPLSRRKHRLNLLRCDSHRELVISALEHDLASESVNGPQNMGG